MRGAKRSNLSGQTVHSLYCVLTMTDCRVMYSIRFRDWIKIIFLYCRIIMLLLPDLLSHESE